MQHQHSKALPSSRTQGSLASHAAGVGGHSKEAATSPGGPVLMQLLALPCKRANGRWDSGGCP